MKTQRRMISNCEQKKKIPNRIRSHGKKRKESNRKRFQSGNSWSIGLMENEIEEINTDLNKTKVENEEKMVKQGGAGTRNFEQI
ncbi:hypothetical protein T4B_10211 [Trichinella pseudospiralis]|uniref:Uncharacterized protein n=1 Tax=Trichinella pseudospiralis TaxID=6337 RepID=A0A0V1ISJ6_TRIPS|nr:hypothetical protein T4B_10211 [Trichinella pseudospiralis]